MRIRLWLIVAVFVVLLAPTAWYLGSPLSINKAVDVPLPSTAGPAERISQ
jgi:hypothetical protein